jgi:hypothetical protein
MSETINPNVNDNNDDDSSEDLEEAKSFDLRSLGIEPMTTPIADLVKLYNDNHGIVKSYSDKQKRGESDPNAVETVIKSNLKKTIEAKPENVQAYRAVGEKVSNAFFTSTPVASSLLASAVLLEELENLLSLAKDEYQYHYAKAVQTEKDRLGIKSTPSESAVTAKLACIQLRTLIENRVNIAKLMGDEASIPENLFKTEGQRKGFNTEVLPRTPRLDIEGNSSGVHTSHLTFRFKATGSEEVTDCSETTLHDVAHNVVSNGAYRVTGKQVAADLKKNGHGIGATDTEWSLEYKTGTLYGKKG